MSKSSSDVKLGSVHVSPKAIATIASQALLTCYGVVGMASKNAIDELAASITRDPHHGIEVRVDRGRIVIDAYLIIQHGTRISTVASSVINAVRFNVERSVGLPVHQVNVYVQGLRLTDEITTGE
jgi:uncharacterized alkaline shock family protein YloU